MPKISIQEKLHRKYPCQSLTRSVQTLLQYVPSVWLAGVREIYIRDTESLTSSEKRRYRDVNGKKVSRCKGYYSERSNDPYGYITLFIDEIFTDQPMIAWKLPILRDSLIAHTLYHEVGHHICKQRKETREMVEQKANEYRNAMRKRMFWRRYWYIAPWLTFILWIMGARSVSCARLDSNNNPGG